VSGNSNGDSNKYLDTLHSIEEFGKGAVRISQSAARVKRAEIMSHSVLPKSISKVTPSPADAASLRGLLLSTAEDWRALAIRASACLYRLRGLLAHEQSSLAFYGLSTVDDSRNRSAVREAREALYIYAPLAERLGMQRLKSELENTAFRVLYRRQYNAAQSIYARSGAAIQSVTDFLTKNIEHVLKQDPWLAPQLERLTVTSRVKKPYSLWRKLLKARSKSKSTTTDSGDSSSALYRGESDDELSIASVQDAIAMRVIVKAKKIEGDEDGDLVRSREEFLCYYIQNRLMQLWPAVDSSRIKDYISMPKPNGYQSLHHISQLFRYGCHWPFEVQIRTEDMHTKSEYGVAAHWDYKLTGGTRGSKEPSLPMLEGVGSPPRGSSPVLLEEMNGMELSAADLNDLNLGEVGEGKIGSLTRSSMLESSINALSTAREHLIDNSVFVFFLTSDSAVEGKVIGLPAGSSVADALIEICKRCNLNVPQSFDASDFDVFLNGELVDLHDSMNSGDTLVVPSLDSRIARYLM